MYIAAKSTNEPTAHYALKPARGCACLYYLNEETVLVIVIRISSYVVSVYLKLNGRHLRQTTTVKPCTLTMRQITATSQPTISRHSTQMSEMSVKTFTQWLRTISEKINNY